MMLYSGYIHRRILRQVEMHIIYNFSRDACAENAERMTQDYLAALSDLDENLDENLELTVNDGNTTAFDLNIKWNREPRE